MRIFMIDDQFIIRKKIKDVISALAFTNLSLNEITNEQEFYQKISELEIFDDDFFILDIDLKTYFSGIDLAEKIRQQNKSAFIVFLSAFDSKGIEILNRQIFPLGYLLKDQSADELTVAIETLLKKANLKVIEKQKEEQILVLDNFETDILILESNIFYAATVPGFKKTVLIKHKDGECMVRGKLSDLKKSMKSPYICKELKSFIINLALVKNISTLEGTVQFTDGTSLEIGKVGARKMKLFLKGLELNEL
ncbi:MULTISPECIES: response regulator transcription factor [Enterococcus]|uniref:Response regulator n=1 Tax=Enterococcus alishanensis TaxID=1303817 RepID=A0ABS6T9D8_9ENTE|nr:response regulator [Enterococcus alishanensis]MBV7389500.1 response regulator [Enterococcus alishanensis]